MRLLWRRRMNENLLETIDKLIDTLKELQADLTDINLDMEKFLDD